MKWVTQRKTNILFHSYVEFKTQNGWTEGKGSKISIKTTRATNQKRLVFVYLFLREREAERERDTESEAGSRLWAASTEPNAGLELTSRKIMTWAEVGHLTDWTSRCPHKRLLNTENKLRVAREEVGGDGLNGQWALGGHLLGWALGVICKWSITKFYSWN